MEKLLCWLSMGVAGLVLVLFLADLILGIPFGRISMTVSIIVILAAAIMLYISWETVREMR